jgi:hypothetical protein
MQLRVFQQELKPHDFHPVFQNEPDENQGGAPTIIA